MRTERNVMMAASRSKPECNASERTPKLPVRTTKNVLSETNSNAEPTLRSAARFFSRPSSTWLIISIARLDYLNSPESPARAALFPLPSNPRQYPASLRYVSYSSRGTCLRSKDDVLSRRVPGDLLVIRRVFFSIVLASLFATCSHAETPVPSPAASVWNALSAPAMDPAKSAHTENVVIVRDRIHITLTDGTIQFTQPINSFVFGAVFHGSGRVQLEPPNPIEAQQLRLFTKQEKLDMPFSEGTFSFTDGLLDEVAKQVKWEGSSAAGEDLYTNRQKTREDLGEAALPRLLQGILSADRARTAYFLADLKVAGKDWVEFRYDALDPEEIRVGRWVDVGPLKLDDTWMHFPARNQSSADALKDPLAKEDFVIRAYNINASVTSGAELSATTKMTLAPRLAGQSVLIFDFDSNLRIESVKDTQGTALSFYQARETKDRYQSYGYYVAVILSEPLAPGKPQTLEFRYSGKRAIRKAGNGNYFCESSGWYPELSNSFATRADFDMTFRSEERRVGKE